MTELLFILFVLGISIGSFIGAAAYRLPRRISFIRRRSFCVSCGSTLRWFEIIPLVSYIALKGRSSRCGARIPLRDFLVELAGGLILVGPFLAFGPSVRFIESSVFLSLMLLIALIDAEHLIIPDSLVVSGLVLGVTLRSLIDPPSLLSAVLSGTAASALLLSVLVGANWLFRKQTMGMGDVKLASVLGLFIGLGGFVFALWLAAVFALAAKSLGFPRRGHSDRPFALSPRTEGVLRALQRDVRIPFGSVLAVSSSLVMIFREHLGDLWLAWLTLLQ